MNKEGQSVLQKIENVIEETKEVIDKQIVTDSIIETVKNLKVTFFKGIKKCMVKSNSCDDILEKAQGNNWGIYLFILKLNKESQIKEFKEDWNEFKKNLDKNVPALRKKSPPYKEDAKVGIRYSLYIGKSNKISSRLEQHIKGSDTNSSTYFLRLKDFEAFTQEKGRNYHIEIIYIYSNSYEISHALPLIEKRLHRNFTALLGTSR